MFPFLEKIKNEKYLESPLQKINLLISQKDKKPFCFLPYDVFEKILGNILFSFLEFHEGENLLPEKRLEKFEEYLKNLSIEKDFVRLCEENKLYELSVLLNNDKTDMIARKNPFFNGFYYNGFYYISLAEYATEYTEGLEILKLLHEKGRNFTLPQDYGKEQKLMDNASSRRSLEVVKWFYENRPEGCTDRAIEGAALNGKLENIIFLCENTLVNCTIITMYYAVRNGHLEVVKWVQENYPEFGRTNQLIEIAVEKGHNEIVSYLKGVYKV